MIHLVHNSQDKPHVRVTDQPFMRRGDVSNWLTSKAFDLGLPDMCVMDIFCRRKRCGLLID